jgi:hypothetical protein
MCLELLIAPWRENPKTMGENKNISKESGVVEAGYRIMTNDVIVTMSHRQVLQVPVFPQNKNQMSHANKGGPLDLR